MTGGIFNTSGDEVDQAIERLGRTANSIADKLIACRKLNREWCRALQDIAAAKSLNEAQFLAARALEGPQ